MTPGPVCQVGFAQNLEIPPPPAPNRSFQTTSRCGPVRSRNSEVPPTAVANGCEAGIVDRQRRQAAVQRPLVAAADQHRHPGDRRELQRGVRRGDPRRRHQRLAQAPGDADHVHAGRRLLGHDLVEHRRHRGGRRRDVDVGVVEAGGRRDRRLDVQRHLQRGVALRVAPGDGHVGDRHGQAEAALVRRDVRRQVVGELDERDALAAAVVSGVDQGVVVVAPRATPAGPAGSRPPCRADPGRRSRTA